MQARRQDQNIRSPIQRFGADDMVTRVLVENLSLRLLESEIFSASGSTGVPVDATLDVDLSRFDADPDNVVILDARWVIRREARVPLARFDRITMRPGSSATVDLVSAMSDALGALGDGIANTLASTA